MLRRWYLLTIAIVVLGLLAVVPYGAVQQQTARRIDEITPIAQRSIQLEKELANVRSQISRLDQARSHHLSMTGHYPPLAALSVVSEFCSRHPNAIRIASFDYSNSRFPRRDELPPDILKNAELDPSVPVSPPAVTPDGTVGTVIIKAHLNDPALATALLGALKASKLFKDVALMNHNVDREDQTYFSSIDLTCKF